ncbi:MAG: immunoglobulin domain-containing protein, partial [Verrucomicrobia bacterium]|nr:immunoglobulin domain-containing protein [Verrucomicrobiota bacterium]
MRFTSAAAVSNNFLRFSLCALLGRMLAVGLLLGSALAVVPAAVAAPGQQLVAVGAGGTLLTSPTGQAWTSRTSGTTLRLRAASASSDLIVVVGEAGTVLTSPDGVVWTARNSTTTETLRGVAAGSGRFVAVGGASSSLVLTSTDGLSWGAATVPPGGTLRAVAWNGSQFAAVGKSGTILTSPDGLTWTSRTSGTSERLDGVLRLGTQFVAFGETGRVLTSSDGVTWSSSFSSPPAWIEGLALTDTRFVAVGALGRLYTSPDGGFWTAVAGGTEATIHGVAWTSTSFTPSGSPVTLLNNLQQVPVVTSAPVAALAGLGGSATFRVVASGAGTLTYQWRRGGAPISDGARYSGTNTATLSVANLAAGDAGSYTVQITGSAGTALADATLVLRGQGSAGQQFVAVGEGGAIYTSSDAVTWTERASGTTKRLRAATATADLFVVAGETGTILTSADGASWTLRNSGTTQTLRGVTAGPAKFVAVGGATNSLILTSPDGISWSAATAPTLGTLRSVTWGNGLFVAVGQGGAILTSPDGVTWTSRAAGTFERLDGVLWTGSQFVIIGQTGNVLTSPDAVSWSPTSSFPPAWLEGMTWSTNQLVVVGSGGRIATSADGAAWTTRYTGSSRTVHGVTWSSGAANLSGSPTNFLGALRLAPDISSQPAATYAGTGGAATFRVNASGSGSLTYQWRLNGNPIADGAKYSGTGSPTLILNNAQAGDVGSYSVVVSGGASGAYSTSASLTLKGQGTLGQQFVAVGQGGTILTSPDAANWTSRTSGTTKRLRGAVATATQFVVVGETGTVLTSTDGATWVGRASGTLETLRGVTASPNLVVAVGGAGAALILNSANGNAWTQATVPSAGALRGVATGNGLFVAAGANGTILTSSDGLAWSLRSSGTTDRLDGVVWTGTQFSIVTETGRLLTSTDGVSWAFTSANSMPSWLEGLTWSTARYVVVGAGGQIATSPDGGFWTGISTGTTATLHGVAWSGGAFLPSTNPLNLLANLNQIPAIGSQPGGAVAGVGTGTSVSLQVGASGSGALSYQWRFNGVPLTNDATHQGVATAVLTLSNLQPGDAGLYSVVVTNSFGSRISSNATVELRGNGSTRQQFLAVGENGTILSSADGLAWTARSSGTTKRLRAATASASQFVVVGETGTVLVSADGSSWTARDALTTETLRGVARGPNLFVAVGGASASLVRTSPDAVTWSAATVPALGTLRGVVWGNGLFVATGKSGTLLTSPDGIVWTSRSAGTTERLDGVVWTGSQFVVISETGRLLTSSDGVSWSSTTASLPSWLEAFTWSNSRYIVTGAGGRIALSADGGSWTSVPSGTAATLHGVTWSGGTFNPAGNPATLLANLQGLPVITAQPAPVLVADGGSASLTVAASGSGLTYQWLKDGLPVAGATNATLTIGTAHGRDGGVYSVRVNGAAGSAVSSGTSLTVAPTYTFSTIAGSAGSQGNVDGVGSVARFSYPNALVSNNSGALYVADIFNSSLRKVTSPAGVVATLAAGLTQPRGAGIDGAGNVYVLDGLGDLTQLKKISPLGVVSVVAGGVGPTSDPDGTGTAAQFNAAFGVTSTVDGTLFVADTYNHTIRKVTPGGVVTTIAGMRGNPGGADGIGSGARFNQPDGIAVDSTGVLYVADWLNSTIRKISPDGAVSTLAGLAGVVGSADGVGSGARFAQPAGITVDSAGRIFVVDGANHTIRLLTATGGVVTIGGLASFGGSADGVGSAARFFQPNGVAVDSSGDLFVADSSNQTIRRGVPSFRFTAITTQPQDQSVLPGLPATFSVSATGTGTLAYQWLKNNAAITGATNATYSIPVVQAADQAGYSVFVSGDGGSLSSAVASLTVGSVAPSFNTHPQAQNALAGQTISFSVTVAGDPTPALQWRKNGAPIGGATGAVYTLFGVTSASAGSYDVVATNSAGIATSTAATLTVTTPVTPPPVVVPPPVTPSVTVAISGLEQTYDGTPKSVTVTPSSPVTTTVVYSTPGGNAPANAGSYQVTVSFFNGVANTSSAATLVIAKAPQTVAFSLTGSDFSVGSTLGLVATASSGLPVTFSVVSGSAALSGSTASITGPGPVSIRASQAGNDNYLPASADRGFTGVETRTPQTIAFAALPNRKVNDGALSLSATASSGLPVSFSVSGPAALSGGTTLTLTGIAGVVTVKASQAGNATFAAAPDVTRSFVVVDPAPSIFFGDLVDDPGVSGGEPGRGELQQSTGPRLDAKSGDIAAVLFADTRRGTVLIVAPTLGLNVSLDFALTDAGIYSVAFTSGGQPFTLTGALNGTTLTGRIPALRVSFSTQVQTRTGTTGAIAGFYQSSTLDTATGGTTSIIGPNGQLLIVATTGTVSTGALGTVAANGAFSVSAPGATISGAVDVSTTTVTGTIAVPNQAPVSFSGISAITTRTDRLINLSSRVLVGPAVNRTFITGFVLGGGASKRVLLRAVGPALSGFGVQGALSNPRLQLFDAAGKLLLENDDWSGSDTAATAAQVGAFSLVAGSKDAALFTTLAPGAYTMQIIGGADTGVAIAEIYDASASPNGEPQRLVNISTRGEAGTGENVLIGGFIVTGNAPKKVLVRGIGP